MVLVPPPVPVTMPDVTPTVATAVLLLAHVPPVTASLSVVVVPWQRLPAPAMAVGVRFTVIVAVVIHTLS